MTFDKAEPRDMREYIIDAVEVGAPVQVVIRTVVHRFGVEKIASMAGLRPQEVELATNPRKKVSIEAINRLLAPFDLRMTVTGIEAGSSASSCS